MWWIYFACILATSAVVVSAIALIGHLLNFPILYLWNIGSTATYPVGMAFPTALAMGCTSTAVVIVCVKVLKSWNQILS